MLKCATKGTTESDLKKRKVLSLIATLFTALIVALTAYVVVSIVIARVQDRDVSLFGYSFGIVMTNSMEPEISVGDLIIFTHEGIENVEEGDYIVFVAGEGFDSAIRGQNVVHMAEEIVVGEGVSLSIITRGTNNAAQDEYPVTEENFVGLCVFHSSGWGAFFSFIMQYGILILIAVVALPFIVKQIIKIVRLSREGDGQAQNGEGSEDEK